MKKRYKDLASVPIFGNDSKPTKWENFKKKASLFLAFSFIALVLISFVLVVAPETIEFLFKLIY